MKPLLLLFFSVQLHFFALDAIAGGIAWEVFPRSREVFQGGIARIRVSKMSSAGVKARFRTREIVFFSGEGAGAYEALLGVDLKEEPGPKRIVIQDRGGAKEKEAASIRLQARRKEFPVEKLSVPVSKDRFDKATLERIRREKARLTLLWRSADQRRRWQGAFIAPVPGGITSAFGRRRIINGTPRSPHGGVDLRAAQGAKVVAANHGRIALLDEFFFSGKSLVLDHGGGLYTMYFHLDEFRVAMGSRVGKGEEIGRAGMTGRVTGPHLHWGVRLNGARVDPFSLLALN